MYTYNKDDKSYTFSSDELDIDAIINLEESGDKPKENQNTNQKPKKIEVINGGNDLDISPVNDYLEVEKPKNEKRDNIVIPKEQ